MNLIKKRLRLRLALMSLLVFIVTTFVWTYFFKENGRISINSEYAKLYLLKGGYRSWTISYNHGRQFQLDGTWRNLWKWPTFHHVDVRKFLKNIKNEN